MGEEETESKSKGKSTLFKLQYFSTALILLTGIVLVVVCSLWEMNIKPYSYVIEPAPRGEVYTIFVIGVILMLLAVLGSLSTMSQSYCLLVIYSSLLIVSVVVKIFIGIVLMVYGSNPTVSIGRNLITELSKCDNFSPFFSMFYEWQQTLNCCGVGGADDYRYSLHCWSRVTECYLRYSNIGCADAISSIVSLYTSIVAGLAIATSIVELFAAVVGCILFMWIKKQI